MECPKCHEKLVATACVPDESRITVELQFDSPYLAAATLGGVITNTTDLLVAIAKDMGSKIGVFVTGISYGDQKCRVEFVVLPWEPAALEAERREDRVTEVQPNGGLAVHPQSAVEGSAEGMTGGISHPAGATQGLTAEDHDHEPTN